MLLFLLYLNSQIKSSEVYSELQMQWAEWSITHWCQLRTPFKKQRRKPAQSHIFHWTGHSISMRGILAATRFPWWGLWLQPQALPPPLLSHLTQTLKHLIKRFSLRADDKKDFSCIKPLWRADCQRYAPTGCCQHKSVSWNTTSTRCFVSPSRSFRKWCSHPALAALLSSRPLNQNAICVKGNADFVVWSLASL